MRVFLVQLCHSFNVRQKLMSSCNTDGPAVLNMERQLLQAEGFDSYSGNNIGKRSLGRLCGRGENRVKADLLKHVVWTSEDLTDRLASCYGRMN